MVINLCFLRLGKSHQAIPTDFSVWFLNEEILLLFHMTKTRAFVASTSCAFMITKYTFF